MQDEKFGIGTKKIMLNELKERFNSSSDFVITNYKGLTSPEIEELKRELGKSSSKYFVVKNSILKRIFDERNLGELRQYIKGEVGIGFVGDVIAASKTFVNFSRDHKSFKLNCTFIDGKVEEIDMITRLAALPSRDVLLCLALSYMKSPILRFVGTLKGLLRRLVYAISEIEKKRNK